MQLLKCENYKLKGIIECQEQEGAERKKQSDEVVQELERRLQELEDKYEKDTKDLELEIQAYKSRLASLHTPKHPVLTERPKQNADQIATTTVDFSGETTETKPTPNNAQKYSSFKDFDSREMSENKVPCRTAHLGLTKGSDKSEERPQDKSVVNYY